MKDQRGCQIRVIVALCVVLVGSSLMTSRAQEVDLNEQICRSNLQLLGRMLGLYFQENDRQFPKKISQLYGEYVLDLGVFVCPGSGNQVTSKNEIDKGTDFEIVSEVSEERPARLVWQKSAIKKGPRLAFYSDGKIREIKESGDTQVSVPTVPPGNGETTSTDTTPGSGSTTSEGITEAEPNNSKEKASAIEIGKTVKATVEPKGDTDWYRVEVDNQGALGVKLDKVPKELSMAFRVYDGKGDRIGPQVTRGVSRGYGWMSAKKQGEGMEGVVDLPQGGTYYLEVKDWGNARSEKPYELALGFTATADASEPNNSKENASAIEAGKAVKATILPRGDKDWYRLEVDNQGALRVKIDKVPEELTVAFRVYDAKGGAIGPQITHGANRGYGWMSAAKQGEGAEGVVDLPQRGTYYLEVKDWGNARSEKPYELALGFTATADTSEPNASKEKASPIEVGKAVKAAILPKGDKDWYRLEVDNQGALGVKIDKVPGELTVAFRVYDAKGTAIGPQIRRGVSRGYGWMSAKKQGEGMEGVVDLPQRGTYYLEVKDWGNARSEKPYELALGFTASADKGESNNSRESASPIEVGKSLQANVLPGGDKDWYWLSIGHQGALAVKLDKVPKELTVAFRVYDGKGSPIGPQIRRGVSRGYGWMSAKKQGEGMEGVVDLPLRGTYYLEVKDWGKARSKEPYELALEFTGTADDGEPDGSKETATPIEIGQTVQAAVLPKGDKDWYRLEVDTQGTLSVKIDEAPEELDVAFRAYDEKGNPIGPQITRGVSRGYGWMSAKKPGEAAEGVVNLPLGGTYYLEVKDWGDNARSTNPYSLSTSFPTATE